MRSNGQKPMRPSDREIWQQSRLADAPHDELALLLDLAAFADEQLDPDERERIADLLARNSELAADIRAARQLAGGPAAAVAHFAVAESVLARAAALIPEPAHGRVVPFPTRRRPLPRVYGVAGWGSFAAAMLVAGWLGFSLGTETLQALGPVGQTADDGFLHELFDPSIGIARDLPGNGQT